MSESYRPTLMDVARLVSGTRQGVAAPEAAPLLAWLISEDAALSDLWKKAHEVLGGGVTLIDVAALQHTLEAEPIAGDRRPSTSACATAAKLIRTNDETREIWDRLEQMGRDAGLADDWPLNAAHVVAAHEDVETLLGTEGWTTSDECLDPARHYQPEPGLLVRIVEARLGRGEGDRERLAEVRDKLRAEIAVAARVERESETST